MTEFSHSNLNVKLYLNLVKAIYKKKTIDNEKNDIFSMLRRSNKSITCCVNNWLSRATNYDKGLKNSKTPKIMFAE